MADRDLTLPIVMSVHACQEYLVSYAGDVPPSQLELEPLHTLPLAFAGTLPLAPFSQTRHPRSRLYMISKDPFIATKL